MVNLEIRLASANDASVIAVLGITTCYEAYFELDPSNDLAEYCLRFYNKEIIESELADRNSTYLIAESDGKAVGFAKLRVGKTVECLDVNNAIEIQRIYLLEKTKGKGFGRKMVEKCLEIGRDKGFRTIWLGVWDLNIEAQKFYQKIGMKNVGTTDFSDGKNKFINFVFAMDL